MSTLGYASCHRPAAGGRTTAEKSTLGVSLGQPGCLIWIASDLAQKSRLRLDLASMTAGNEIEMVDEN